MPYAAWQGCKPMDPACIRPGYPGLLTDQPEEVWI